LAKSKELDLAFAACQGFTMAKEEVRMEVLKESINWVSNLRLLNLEQPKVDR
jgi:hypothetical protein